MNPEASSRWLHPLLQSDNEDNDPVKTDLVSHTQAFSLVY